MNLIPELTKVWFYITKTARRVFRTLQKHVRQNNMTFPAYETIAKWANCSRASVGRALQFLKSIQVIGWKKVPYRSNQYHIRTDILKLNMDNPKTFKRKFEFSRQNETQCETVFSCIFSKGKEDLSKVDAHARLGQIPDALKHFNGHDQNGNSLTDAEKQNISNKFAVDPILRVIEAYEKMRKRDKPIRSILGFFLGLAKTFQDANRKAMTS